MVDMKCVECRRCYKYLYDKYIVCRESGVIRKMDINTEQPKWCEELDLGSFSLGDLGIVLDDDGFV